jgi:predicted SAM-dependent methyltransferase/SAM-dependent methyltransferase
MTQLALNIGCHDIKLPGFVNIDLDPDMKPDIIWDCTKLLDLYKPGEVAYINAGHFLEHFPAPIGKQIVKDCYTLLAPFGTMVMTCPDFTKLAGLSLEEKDRIVFGDMDHRVLMNSTRMTQYLREAGFTTVASIGPEDYGLCPFPQVNWQTVAIGIKHANTSVVVQAPVPETIEFKLPAWSEKKENTFTRYIPTVPGDLSKIALGYGTDKLSHGFLPYYEEALMGSRENILRVLEIGVHEGQSLQMWRDYFPNAEVEGWDIRKYTHNQFGERTLTKVVNQEDAGSILTSLTMDEEGNYPLYDLIIDDGSHTMSAQQTSLGSLWQYLKPGGIFIVEDLHTSLPHNPHEWAGGKCREDFSNSSLRALQVLGSDGVMKSEYINEVQQDLISSECQSCVVIDTMGDERHITSILHKKSV